MGKVRTIGIYGGSFNPIHKGHIALAKQILRQAQLDEVWFMVSPLNPFKVADADLLDDHLRLQMAQKALEKEPGLYACDYEFHLPRPSYTWDTLQALHNDYPDDEFVLIIGADNWLKFDRWYHSADLLGNYRIVVYARENSPVDTSSLPQNVMFIDTRLYRMSSTDIRQRIREGRPIKRLVPEAILDDVAVYKTMGPSKEAGKKK